MSIINGRMSAESFSGNEFRALDNRGNPIFRVHNKDLFLKNNLRVSLVNSVESTDRGLYLGDSTNNQVIVMKWTAQAKTLISL